MLYISKSRGPIDIAKMGPEHLVATIKKLRRDRGIAQATSGVGFSSQLAEQLTEMEREAGARGLTVDDA